MYHSFKQGLIVALITSSLAAAGPAGAQQRIPAHEPSSGEIAADVLLARPAGLVATVVGSAVFFLGLPFALTTGTIDRAAEKLIEEPANYTLLRPLGEDFR